MLKNKKNKKAILFDIKPIQKSKFFDFSLKDNLSGLEFSLIDDLKNDEIIIKEKEKNKAKEQKQRELQLRMEAASFNDIYLDSFFTEKEISSRIVSSRLNKEFIKKEAEIKKRIDSQKLIEKKQQEIIELGKIETAKQLELMLAERKRLKEEEIKRVEIQREIEKKEQFRLKRKKDREKRIGQIKKSLLAKPIKKNNFINLFRPALAFSGFGLTIFLVFFVMRFAFYGFQVKDQVMVKGASVVSDLEKVKDNFQRKDFTQLVLDLEKIQREINYINQELEKVESGSPKIIRKIPFISKYGSAKNLLEAGNEIAKAMVLIGKSAEDFSKLNTSLGSEEKELSLGEFFLNLEKQTLLAEKYFMEAEKKIAEVNLEDIPADYQDQVKKIKDNFPKFLGFLTEFNQKQFVFKDLLGYNGHRKYLFLFQNNHEIRATGGFIGSYGLLNIYNGEVEDFFIDGIFNPDGQLSVRVVPPKPIQKISTNWSTHDANWYPNFPTSAQKISWFYEKTGGPTVDGIITLTPTVIKKLLKTTGPIEMTDYGLVIDSENFMENIQSEVEVNYDKEENQPKKIISDLAPKILEKVFSEEGLNNLASSIQTLTDSLNEKHILIYSQNPEIQKIVSNVGWSGEVLEAKKDYLMVVNSNINGYKTDGVIDQNIEHKIEIEEDGSIINTVIIERFHNGGSTKFDWWNQVNANYMRVYVPKGSELLESSGYTRETINSPVNYDKLGFQRDELVDSIEKSVRINNETGTEIWEESGKTVFGNWVYVSPQEKVRLVYKYRLPFKLDIRETEDKMDNYSILYQKQSGMETSKLKVAIKLAKSQEIFWKYPDLIESNGNDINYESNLERDRFLGVVIK